MEIKKKVNIKGGAILDTLKYINDTFSQEEIERAKQSLSATDRATLFARTIMPISWVCFDSVINYLVVLDQQVGKGDLKMLKDMAEITSERNFKGVYKIFTSMLSPKNIINKFPNIWKQIFDQGECRLVWENDHEGSIEVTNWEAPLNHELLQIPYYIKALTTAGAKNIQIVHTKCIARGDDECFFQFEFE